MTMRVFTISTVVCISVASVLAAGQAATKLPKGPERFSANVQATQGASSAATILMVAIDRYPSDKERAPVAEALRTGGYPAFLVALRKSPTVGHIEIGDKKYNLRWASQRATPNGRSVVAVTDEPIYFLGGGRVEAKPKAGYEVGVVQFEVDDVGLGSGTIALAARVKPGGATGVVLDDYAEVPAKLVTVRKLLG